MSKRCFAFLLLASILLASCSWQGASQSASSTASIPQAYWQGEPAEPVPLGETMFSFTAEVQGQSLGLPGSPVQLLQSGWQNSGFEEVFLQPGEQLETTFTNDDVRITALVANFGGTKQAAYKCQLTGLILEQGEWRLPQGIAPGSSREEIEKICGLPKETGEENLLLYEVGKQYRLEFWLNEQQTLQRVRLENTVPRRKQRLAEDALPVPVQEYTAPEELGESWTGGVVQYGGKLYKMPAPVDAFLEDGWLLLEESEELVAPGEWLMGVRLAKGNQILRTCVWNYADTPQPIAACFVSTLYSGKDGPQVDLLLSGGIGQGSSWEEVLAVYGEPSIEYKNIQARYYTFGTAKQGVQFQLAKDEDRIEGITLRFDFLE